MNPNGQIKFMHLLENGSKFRQTEWFTKDIGKYLNSLGTQLIDRTINLKQTSLYVVHGHGSNKTRKSIGMFVTNLSQAVVGNLRQQRRHLWAT